jgi:twitching motility protein PilT
MELLITSDFYPETRAAETAAGRAEAAHPALAGVQTDCYDLMLRELLDWCQEMKVSDIQFRSDRLLYVETHVGMQILEDYGTLTGETVLGLLRALASYKEETDPIFLQQVRGAGESVDSFSQILTKLKETRVADFSCRAVPLDAAATRWSGRLRIQAHFSGSGLGITCRILSDSIPELEALGFAPDSIASLRDCVTRRAGLCLVTGPTGSGKSTTLAALIDWVRRNYRKHIVTLEDPVEYLYPHDLRGPGGMSLPAPGVVTQQEVGRDIASYRQGLKDVLRKAPHIILLGEIRDREAMETCMEAAQTGHLVLSTLHTTGSVKTLGRILEMFPRDKHESVLSRLSEILMFILSQGLLRTPHGRALTYEFLLNQDDACASAIAGYHRGAGALNDVIGRSGNIEWDANLMRLLQAGRIDQETFANNRMRKDSGLDI